LLLKVSFVNTSRLCRKPVACLLALATAASIAIPGVRAAQASGAGATDDAIGRLGSQLASGTASLEWTEGRGYLSSLLHLLAINVDSQVLVFSKTSFQHTLIDPKHPRAVYFNDNVAIGMVQRGTVYEMMALGATNRLGALGVQYRQAERIGAADPKSLDASVRDLADYLLFVGEVPLREPVRGVSSFTQTFAERGPRDARGRSLREFDLRTRLFGTTCRS
jgi:hypothetical protein